SRFPSWNDLSAASPSGSPVRFMAADSSRWAQFPLSCAAQREPEQMQPTRHPDRFVDRHIGPNTRDVEEMLAALGVRNLDELIDRTVPASIRMQKPLDLPAGRSEFGLLRELSGIA